MDEEIVTADNSPVLLVVDDSAIIRKMIMTALRSLNPVFREASSGLEALEQIMLRDYDLIMLDLNMPDMHGLEFLQFVRNHKKFKNIPIVVITTHNEDGVRKAVLAAGANTYITKPFAPGEVLARVKELLETVS